VLSHRDASTPERPSCRDEILQLRHHSPYVPRDFDISAYFQLVKPTLAPAFDPQRLLWAKPATRLHGSRRCSEGHANIRTCTHGAAARNPA
jgi:hypothetical protein